MTHTLETHRTIVVDACHPLFLKTVAPAYTSSDITVRIASIGPNKNITTAISPQKLIWTLQSSYDISVDLPCYHTIDKTRRDAIYANGWRRWYILSLMNVICLGINRKEGNSVSQLSDSSRGPMQARKEVQTKVKGRNGNGSNSKQSRIRVTMSVRLYSLNATSKKGRLLRIDCSDA